MNRILLCKVIRKTTGFMLNYIKILYINNFLLYEEEKEDFFMNYLHCLKEKMLDLMSNLGYTDNTMKQQIGRAHV